MKRFKFLVLGLLMVIGIGAFANADTTIVIQGNESAGELISQLEQDAKPVIEAIKDDSFPPTTTAGWIAFLISVILPFLTKMIGDKAKYLDIFKDIKMSGNTNAIIVWVSVGLSGLYEFLVSRADFSFTDWGGYAILVYAAGMAVHEAYKAISNKGTKTS